MKKEYLKPKIDSIEIFIESAIANTSNINANGQVNIEEEQFIDDGDSGNFLEW